MIIRAILGVILSGALSIGMLYGAHQFFGVAAAPSGGAETAETDADPSETPDASEEPVFEMGLEDWAMSAQGDWTSVTDPASRVRIEGPVYQEFYDGALMLERRIEWRFGCDGLAEDMPAFVMVDPDTDEVESCTFLLDVGPDEMGFARIGLRTSGTVADRIYSEMGAPQGLEEWAAYMEGDWIENGGTANTRLRFEGARLIEYSNGALVSEHEVRWQTGCEGSDSQRTAFVKLDAATGAPESCTFVRYLGIELIGFRESGADEERQYIVPNFPL
jgi:hypothetical protein